MFDFLRNPLKGKKGFIWSMLMIAVDMIHPELAIVETVFTFLSEHPLFTGGVGLATLRAGINNAANKTPGPPE